MTGKRVHMEDWSKLSEKYELEPGKEYTIDADGWIHAKDKKT